MPVLPLPAFRGETGGPGAAGRWRVAVGHHGPPCGQPVLQLTVGQFQLPLLWIVTPQVLPLPLGRATRVWPSG
ncbi:hypothetical protein GCM10010451_31910 [Streptomyces virens]|uniref:Uncharacterized protein n=1 Tax=Streptomyces virens TaxID=285572 RepID=A0ABP6PL88_9ACTN|nr:hypothetical protein GCM10010247_14960 [Streptomyces calvus]